MKVRFWGVRGSVPCATSNHVLYGGNTSCVSVEVANQFIIFDAGSGVRDAGLYAMENNILHTHMFLSHFHMDHILGFPFYGPLWSPQYQLDVYAGHVQQGLKAALAQAFAPPLFPIPFSKLPARIQYHDLKVGHDMTISDNICISNTSLNHPDHATGFRLTYERKTLCYVTDTEHIPGTLDEGILRLINDADVLIYDCSYTDDEYPRYISWGHSTWQEGIRLCRKANVKILFLFHHDPSHTDDIMDQITQAASKEWSHAFVAKQGMVITV